MNDFDFNIDNDFLDFNELEFDFNAEDFELNDDLFIDKIESRYVKPTLNREIKDSMLKSDNAYQLVKHINMNDSKRYFVVVNGAFIFGDFIEAFLYEYRIKATTLTINTLSLSEDNINSLAGLMDAGYIDNLNLLVSHYFYANEKHSLMPYIYESLDIDNRFQLAVCSTHCKTILIHSSNDRYYVIHGSANLRSSQNLEQFVIEENKELYDFNMDFSERLLNEYKTIKKEIRSKRLWHLVQGAVKAQKKAVVKNVHQKN